jgi:hypothetical protein
LGGQTSQRVFNVVPRDDGYGPWPAHEAFTAALPAACRGYFVARHASGVHIFAGTVDRLYKLDNSTLQWVDVSLGGNAYASLASEAMWRFAQFNNFVLATHRNEVLQRFDLGTPTAFAVCPGSPPQAGDVTVVNRFVVLADIASNPNRIKWSGLNDTEEWTPGTDLSGQQDFPDGGRAMRVAEMSQDVGLILQEGGWRRMAFLPGNVDLVFQIDRLRDEAGLLAQGSLAVVAGQAYFLSTKGFMQVGIDGSYAPIGEEMVDRTFQRQSNAPHLVDLAYDDGAAHLVLAAADPRNNRVVWAYKSVSGAAGVFDRALIYLTTRKRWSPAMVTGEYLAQMISPALTLEGLDAIAPGAIPITGAADNGSGLIRITVGSTATLTTGDFRTISGVGGVTNANGDWTITVINSTTFDLDGSTFAGSYTSGGVVAGDLDALPFSLDDVSTAVLPGLGAVDASHRLGFFTGLPVEARLETAEQRAEGQRANINQVSPRTDAATAYAFLSKRERLNLPYVDGTESEMLEDGNCPIFEEARNGRIGLRIPAETDWTYASGVEIDAGSAGAW